MSTDRRGAGLDELAIQELRRLHAEKRFRLAFSVGLSGQAHLDGDPQALVTEVLRLAHIGAVAEAEHPDTPARLLLEHARHAFERGR